MNNAIKKIIFGLLVLAGGVVFIVFGSISLKEVKTLPTTEAVVSHVQKEWVSDGEGGETQEITIFVTYTIDGEEYTEELQNAKTSLKKGDNITVYYKPGDPTYVSGATKGLAAIQISIGCVIALIGLGMMVSAVIKGR